VLTFSDGAFQLVLEFFSAGNVVLLDENRRIMALQRLVEEKGNNDRYAVGETYNLFDDSLFTSEPVSPAMGVYNPQEIQGWITTKNESQQKKVLSIQKILYQKVPHLSADLIAKNLSKHEINPSSSSLDFLEKADVIAQVLHETELDVKSILESKPVKGYILTKRNPLYDPSKDEEDLKLLYDQFHPFEPLLKSDDEGLIEVSGYNNTLDKFFSTIESSKYALRIQNQENQAKKKLEAARHEKHQQVQRLIDAQEVNKLKGEAILFNADLVEQAKSAVQTLIDQKMDWKTMEKLIKIEQGKNNTVAKLINLPLNLKENKISLNLTTDMPFEDEDSESGPSESDSDSESDSSSEDSFPKKKEPKAKNNINVIIDLGLSAYANASNYFTVKKTTVEKQKKVEQSATRALKNIEQKISKDLKKNLKQENEILRKLRTPYFFEKFNWFISNENYLIISGKDDSQNDMIYHRYITKDDIYVTADVDGASHVFIKNPNKGEVSPSTLTQAGIMALSTSKAWDNKMVTSAWWCYAADVSKSDYDGSILKAGSFRYLKEKQFLPPTQMVMGFGFLWKIKTAKNEKELEKQLEEFENLDIDEIEKEEEEESKDATEESEEQVRDEGEVLTPTEQDDGQRELAQNNEDHDEVEEVEASPEPEETNSAYSKSTKQKRPVRGKKSKLKKIQEKYADQDEEERRLRMEVLGTLKQQNKKEDELKKQQLQKINHLKKIEKKKRQEEITANKYANMKEDVNYEDILNELTPSIATEDEILEAIPVFAPWNALTKCRYRVKIQPGSTKKGKALQEVLHYFSIRPVDESEHDRMFDWPREHEVIKGLKDTELLPSIYVGKLKVLLPGKSSAPKGGAKGGVKKKGKK
jgi:predicted ribosome quality control (RQC) complex YloA/Tae2 family protein